MTSFNNVRNLDTHETPAQESSGASYLETYLATGLAAARNNEVWHPSHRELQDLASEICWMPSEATIRAGARP